MRKLLWWAAAGLAAISAVTGVAGTRLHWEWGDVPTWVGAIATVTALAAAGVGAYFAYRQLAALREQVKLQADALRLQAEQIAADRAESDRIARQELEIRKIELRRQAEQVEIVPRAQTAVLDEGPTFHNVLVARVDNTSSRPIRHVTCWLEVEGRALPAYGWADGLFANRHEVAKINRTPLDALSLIRRGKTVAFFFPVQSEQDAEALDATHLVWELDDHQRISDLPGPGQALSSPAVKYVVRFTDDAGLQWELTDEMRLTQVPLPT